MQEVYVANNPIDATAMQDYLKTHGIDAVVQGELLFQLMGPGALGAPTVSVPDEEADRARLLIEEFERGTNRQDHVPWQCPSCAEVIEPEFGVCWKCGANRPDDPESAL